DGVEISALPINDNAIDVTVQPAAAASPCNVKVLPPNPVMRVVNTCVTGARGSTRTLSVVKDLNQNVLEVSGNLPSGDNGYSESIAISHPAELFIALLKQRLELKGVVVTGGTRTTKDRVAATQAQPPVEITKLESPPLSVIAAQTMKPSQNMYTETLLWTLGEESRRAPVGPSRADAGTPSGPSVQLGLGAVKGFLSSVGIPADAVLQTDGSGMSRRDGVTPASIVQLYTYMAKQSKYAQVWRDALAIGGVDGTLKRRFAGTPASGNLRGKTGTLSQVSALSGYLTTGGGEQLVFSIIVNGVADPRARTSLMDDIVIQLANFNGKVD
ncbi:MAG: D-alanyl-D-alanine carboxypeptidase/D-alanyl-D-alanine-endopeptidase, partial [Acidobacteriota bacterium]